VVGTGATEQEAYPLGQALQTAPAPK